MATETHMDGQGPSFGGKGQDKSLLKAIGIDLILLILSLGIFVGSCYYLYCELLFDRRGVRAEATVQILHGSKNEITYTFQVSGQSETFPDAIEVRASTHDSKVYDELQVGDQIPILYLKHHPETSRILSFHKPFKYILLAVVILMGLCIGVTIFEIAPQVKLIKSTSGQNGVMTTGVITDLEEKKFPFFGVAMAWVIHYQFEAVLPSGERKRMKGKTRIEPYNYEKQRKRIGDAVLIRYARRDPQISCLEIDSKT